MNTNSLIMPLTPECACHVTRLTDPEYAECEKNSIIIQEDNGFYLKLLRCLYEEDMLLNLESLTILIPTNATWLMA